MIMNKDGEKYKFLKKNSTTVISTPRSSLEKKKSKKHEGPEKFYVGIVKPTRKTA